MASGLSQLFATLAGRTQSPETMDQTQFQRFLHRSLRRQGWRIGSELLCRIVLQSNHTAFFVIAGHEFYRHDQVTVHQIFSSKIQSILEGPFKNRLIVVVVHDRRMSEVFPADCHSDVCFLPWQKLHYLQSLQHGIDLADDMDTEQRAWLLDAAGRSASLSRQWSVYEARAGHRQAAIEWAERAMALDPANLSGHQLLVRACIAGKRFEQAAATADRALDREHTAQTLLCKSEAEAAMGRPAEALGWAGKSLAKDPDHAFAYYHIAGLQQTLGDAAAARIAAARAVKLAPGNPGFAKRLAALRSPG